MTERPLFNLSILEEMEDNDFIVQVISLYLKDAPQNIAEIRTAADNNDFPAVERRVHKLKGSTGMLQSPKILNTITELHESAKAENKDGKMHDLVSQLEKEYETLSYALNGHLANLKK